MAVNGIDVSKWQGEIDWQKAKTAGAQFAIIRAGSIDNTSGSCYEDTQFRRNAELAPAQMPIGFYWYFRPNWNALTQADYFCDLIQDKTWKIYPVIDVEEYAAMNKTAVASAVWSFTNRVFQRFSIRPMIYTSPGFWNARVARNTWARDFPLWVAHWNTSTPTLPDDWKKYAVPYKFWQTHVGQDGPDYGMQSKGLDHDVYNGEWDQFVKEFNLGEPEPEPETMWVDDFVIEKVYPMMVEHWGYTGPRPVKRP